MTCTPDKIEAAFDMALTALARICASSQSTNEEITEAAKVLLNGCEMASTQVRKQMMTARVMPLLDAVTRNLSGQLTGDDEFCPVYSLDPAQQSSIIMNITKELG